MKHNKILLLILSIILIWYLCSGNREGAECDETLRGERMKDYRGCQTTTKTGLKCQKWDCFKKTGSGYNGTACIHGGGSLNNIKNKWEDVTWRNDYGLGSHNSCRNPDNSPGGIWCYTTDPKKRWGYCDPVKKNPNRAPKKLVAGDLGGGRGVNEQPSVECSTKQKQTIQKCKECWIDRNKACKQQKLGVEQNKFCKMQAPCSAECNPARQVHKMGNCQDMKLLYYQEKYDNKIKKHDKPKRKQIKGNDNLKKKIKDLEETISKLQFQTKRAKLKGQNLVAVDKLDMGKLSMDLFNWNKIHKTSPVDVNLILGDLIRNATNETKVKHEIMPSNKPVCNPLVKSIEEEAVKRTQNFEYKGYPVFTEPEFPQRMGEKYQYPRGAKAGPIPPRKSNASPINDMKPQPFNVTKYDQDADAGIEKAH